MFARFAGSMYPEIIYVTCRSFISNNLREPIIYWKAFFGFSRRFKLCPVPLLVIYDRNIYPQDLRPLTVSIAGYRYEDSVDDGHQIGEKSTDVDVVSNIGTSKGI